MPNEFWAALRSDPGALALAGASGLALVGALLVPLSPAVERTLLRRHHGQDLALHAALLPWPSMYSYVHTIHVEAHGTPSADCPTSYTQHHPHMPFGPLSDTFGFVVHCGFEGATVQVVSEGRFGTYRSTTEITGGPPWTARW